jgi:cobalt-zinc-cadmium efflux system protein
MTHDHNHSPKGHDPHDHNHGHDHKGHDHHGQSHGLGHSHVPTNFGRAFALTTALNLGLVVVQVVYGLIADSMALLADAGHNFGDAIGLILAWIAYTLGRVRATERFTYGFRSASILSAFGNAVLLLVATGAIVWEALRRFAEPPEVAGVTVMIVAGAGVVINGLSAWILMAGQKNDLNIRGAYLHLVADAAVSVGVVIGGAIIVATGWNWVDPAVSLVIAVVIVWGTWSLLRESFELSMQAVPKGIVLAEVRTYLEGLPGIAGVHHLHVWAMSTTENALTVHLVFPAGHPGDAVLAQVSAALSHKFRIHHPTIQIEIADGANCAIGSTTHETRP